MPGWVRQRERPKVTLKVGAAPKRTIGQGQCPGNWRNYGTVLSQKSPKRPFHSNSPAVGTDTIRYSRKSTPIPTLAAPERLPRGPGPAAPRTTRGDGGGPGRGSSGWNH